MAGDKQSAGELEKPEGRRFEPFKPESVVSSGSVTIAGQAIPYQAIAGTLVVHPKDWDRRAAGFERREGRGRLRRGRRR